MAKKVFTDESLNTLVQEIKSYTDEAVATKADADHNHDDEYYTETEIDSKIATLNTAISGKASSSHSHAVSDINNLQSALDAKVPTSRTINGKALTGDISLTASDVGASGSGHTHSSYVNQNAFSNVKVGDATIAADTTTDTLEIVAGTGISVSGDATNDKVTITNSGVRSIATGSSNGTISVNTNGTSANVAVKGLGTAAYKATTDFDAAGTATTKADAALASAKDYTDEKISLLINNADTDTLDSINELAAAIAENDDAIAALNTIASGKANATDLTSHTSNKENPHGVTLAQLGVNATADELNKMDGVTATTAELNILDGVTATTVELNYVDGVTSNIQTQLNGKADKNHGTHVSYGDSASAVAETSKAGSATTVSRSDHVHSLPVASSSTLGGVKTTSTVSSTSGLTACPIISGVPYYKDTNTVYTHPDYEAKTGKPTANQTPAFGGTATVSQITSDATGHVIGATDRTITIPSTLSNGSGTAGLIKTSSTVTSNSGYTACPVINGVPYYKDTDKDTHYASKNVVGATGATTNTTTALSNGAVYLNSVENGAVTSSHKISGSGATTVTTDASGNIVISSTDNNTTYTSLKNPYALTIQGNGTTLTNGTYDGSAAKTVNITPSAIGAATSNHTHNYLEKTTYEKSAELACGSNGMVCLGKFGAYDTNITIELNSTTSTTYHATIVIHSQNVVANGTGGTVGCYVYDDADNHITPLISVFRPYGSANRQIEVYANLPGWSKNLVHVQGVALSDGGMTDVLTSVSSIPTSISGKQKVTPVNVLTTNFASSSHTHTASSIGAAASSHTHDDRYYTESEVDTKLSGKANTSHGNHVPTTETANNAKFLRNDNTWATVTPANIGAAASSHGTHVSYGTSATAVGSTASAGSATTVSRSDHTHSLSKSAVTTALGYTPPTTNTTYSNATTSAAGLMSSTDKSKLDTIFDLIYPVGSIYMSANSTNPGTLFGGTWVAWGAGRVPVGVGSNGTTNYSTVESTGGAESRSHSHGAKTSGASSGSTGAASGNTGSTTLTQAQMPLHTHGLSRFIGPSNAEVSGYGLTVTNPGFTDRAIIKLADSYINSGGTNYVYVEGAGSSQGHTHTLNSHTHSLNSHTHSVPASDSQSTDVRQPYITCYMWKRTA